MNLSKMHELLPLQWPWGGVTGLPPSGHLYLSSLILPHLSPHWAVTTSQLRWWLGTSCLCLQPGMPFSLIHPAEVHLFFPGSPRTPRPPSHSIKCNTFSSMPPPPSRRKDVFPTSTTKLSHSSCPFKLRPCVFKSYLFFKAQLNVHEVLFGSLLLHSYWCFLRLQLFLSSTDKTFLAFSLCYNYWQACLTPSCTANSWGPGLCRIHLSQPRKAWLRALHSEYSQALVQQTNAWRIGVPNFKNKQKKNRRFAVITQLLKISPLLF